MSQNVFNDLLDEPKALGAAKRNANQLSVPELVRSLVGIEPHRRALAFRLLEKDRAIAVFEALAPDQQASLIQSMADPETLPILEALDTEQRVRLFEELPAKVTKRMLGQLSPRSREAVDMLLGYPEGTAGRRMNLRYLAVRETATTAAALASVRESTLREDDMDLVFVVDQHGFYRGFVRMVRLIKASPDAIISQIIDGREIAISATASEAQAVNLLKEYELPAVPVLDKEGRQIGDITFDDVIDLVEEEATETILEQAGVGTLLTRDKGWSEKLVRGGSIYAIQLRITFLIVTLIGGFLVGGVIEQFEETLEAVVAAAVFIPLVMDMGGNVGTQSSTIFARGLAWNQITPPQFMAYLFREIRIGLVMGVILGAVAGVVAYLWQGVPNGIPQIGLAVGLSLTIVIILGAILGASLPMIMLKAGFDHGPGADPFITTIKDFLGLLIYFALVNWLVGVA